jgi:hypothetical protein
MNRRGFISRLLAAGAGIVLAPVIEKVIPKPTDKPITLVDLQAMVDKWTKDCIAEFNKWCFRDGEQRELMLVGIAGMIEAMDAPSFGSVHGSSRIKIDTILPPSH